MPEVRLQREGEGEGEGVGAVLGGPIGLDPEVARVTNNLTLAEHVGRFIAGQVATQFQDENLADTLKGKNAIMISGSWG
jgi:hypothetical protein